MIWDISILWWHYINKWNLKKKKLSLTLWNNLLLGNSNSINAYNCNLKDNSVVKTINIITEFQKCYVCLLRMYAAKSLSNEMSSLY